MCGKTIIVIGASGLTASECIYQSLKNGDKVIGLTRNPQKLVIPKGSGGESVGLPFDDPKLTIIGGDVTKLEDVQKVFSSAGETTIDGVIISLGGRTSDVGTTMLTDGTNNVISVIQQEKNCSKNTRLVVVTSIGVGDSESQAPYVFKVLMWTMMSKIFCDKNNQEDAVKNSNLTQYCIVRPGQLTEGKPTGVVNVIKGKAGTIPRADVARFCLDAILVDNFPYIGQTPCISSVG